VANRLLNDLTSHSYPMLVFNIDPLIPPPVPCNLVNELCVSLEVYLESSSFSEICRLIVRLLDGLQEIQHPQYLFAGFLQLS